MTFGSGHLKAGPDHCAAGIRPCSSNQFGCLTSFQPRFSVVVPAFRLGKKSPIGDLQRDIEETARGQATATKVRRDRSRLSVDFLCFLFRCLPQKRNSLEMAGFRSI